MNSKKKMIISWNESLLESGWLVKWKNRFNRCSLGDGVVINFINWIRKKCLQLFSDCPTKNQSRWPIWKIRFSAWLTIFWFVFLVCSFHSVYRNFFPIKLLLFLWIFWKVFLLMMIQYGNGERKMFPKTFSYQKLFF